MKRTNKTPSLKEVLNEGFLGMGNHQPIAFGKRQPVKENDDDNWAQETEEEVTDGLSIEEKKEFLEAVSRFNSYGKSVYREHSLKEMTDDIIKFGEMAQTMVYESVDDWYDKQTVKNEMKRLAESVKNFKKTAMEVSQLQNRLESTYEDIGGQLGKYFDIKEIVEDVQGHADNLE